jgi:predicted nucleic acid-binding protein
MTLGVDTTFLIELEVRGAPGHDVARAWLHRVIERGARLALAPQVLAEFIHVATDRARFERPLSVPAAVERAEAWWTAREVKQVHPNDQAVRLFFDWMGKHRLGRKRLLDTLLAATYFANGVTDVVTSNARDYSVFGGFQVHLPTGRKPTG